MQGESFRVCDNREDAAELVSRHESKRKQYRVVSRREAFLLLGEHRYERLCSDAIRNKGPTEKTIYAWNIVDAMMWPVDSA